MEPFVHRQKGGLPPSPAQLVKKRLQSGNQSYKVKKNVWLDLGLITWNNNGPECFNNNNKQQQQKTLNL
jgi:hypothetical protein